MMKRTASEESNVSTKSEDSTVNSLAGGLVTQRKRRKEKDILEEGKKTKPNHTYTQRKTGLLKKLDMMTMLCDVEIGFFMFAKDGSLVEYSSSGDMDAILQRRLNYKANELLHGPPTGSLSRSSSMQSSGSSRQSSSDIIRPLQPEIDSIKILTGFGDKPMSNLDILSRAASQVPLNGKI